MSQQFQKGVTGNIVKIMLNNNVIGFGRSSNVASDFGMEGMYSIGSLGPHEHAPMRWSGTVSLDSFLINRSALDPETLQILDLVAHGVEELKQQTTFNFTFLGKDEEELFTLYECSPSNFAVSIQANQYVGQNATFLPKDMRRGPSSQFMGDVSQGLGAEAV